MGRGAEGGGEEGEGGGGHTSLHSLIMTTSHLGQDCGLLNIGRHDQSVAVSCQVLLLLTQDTHVQCLRAAGLGPVWTQTHRVAAVLVTGLLLLPLSGAHQSVPLTRGLVKQLGVLHHEVLLLTRHLSHDLLPSLSSCPGSLLPHLLILLLSLLSCLSFISQQSQSSLEHLDSPGQQLLVTLDPVAARQCLQRLEHAQVVTSLRELKTSVTSLLQPLLLQQTHANQIQHLVNLTLREAA